MSGYYQQKQQQVQPTVNMPPQTTHEFLHTDQAGVLVPLKQTMWTALIIGGTVFAFTLLFDVLDGWKWGVAAFFLSLAGVWVLRMTDWRKQALKEDWNGWGTGWDGEAEPETHVVRIQMQHVEQNGHINVTKQFDLPVNDDELRELASGLLLGRPFSEREWAGAGKLLSSARFRDLRAVMIRRGLLELVSDKDPRQGYRLTEDGEAVMRDYADLADFDG